VDKACQHQFVIGCFGKIVRERKKKAKDTGQGSNGQVNGLNSLDHGGNFGKNRKKSVKNTAVLLKPGLIVLYLRKIILSGPEYLQIKSHFIFLN
jgi:hypothetical protein